MRNSLVTARRGVAWGSHMGLRILVVLGLVLPASVAMFEMYRRLRVQVRGGPWLGTAFALVLFGAAIASCVWVVRSGFMKHWSSRRYLLACLTTGALLKVLYLLLVRPEATSDFFAMWNGAVHVAEHGWPQGGASLDLFVAETPKFMHDGALTLAARVMLQRGLIYLVPIATLFGDSPFAYGVVNTFAFSASAALVFFLARRWTHETAARAVLLSLLFVPETYFATALPSHDIPGALLLLSALAVFDVVKRRDIDLGSVAGGVFLGAVLGLLEIQRTPAQIWFLGTVFVLLWEATALGVDVRRVGRTALLVLVLPIMSHQCVTWGASKLGVTLQRSEAGKLQAMWIAANNDSWSDAGWRHWYDNYYASYGGYTTNRGPDAPQWARLARDKFLSDLIDHPQGRVQLAARKARQLYSLGDQSWFYFPKGKTQWGWDGHDALWRAVLQTYNRLFGTLYLLALVAVAVLWLRGRSQPGGLVMVACLVSAQALLLIALGQCQARYSYAVWFLAPLLAAGVYSRRTQGQTAAFAGMTDSGHLRAFAKSAATLAAVMALLIASVTLGLGALGSGADWRLLPLAQWQHTEGAQVGTESTINKRSAKNAMNPYRAILNLQSGHAEVHANVPTVPDVQYTIDVYVRWPNASDDSNTPEPASITMKLGTQAVAHTQLRPGDAPHHLTISFAATAPDTRIAFEGNAPSNSGNVFIEFAKLLNGNASVAAP